MISNLCRVILKNGRVCAIDLLSGRMLQPKEALNLAAWLVKAATNSGEVTVEEFQHLLEEVLAQ